LRSPNLVSIITPIFNRGHTIVQTLQSVVGQTYSHWECLVVDDGSSDDTVAVVRSFSESDNRIRLLERGRPPKGACTCRNIGVEESSGDYLIFLDSDDILAPHCLAQRVSAFAASPNSDFIVFPGMLFRSQPYDEGFLWNVLTDEEDVDRFLRLDSPWQTTGPMWRRESFERIGGWNEELACWQDVDISLRSFLLALSYRTRFDLPPDLHLRRGDGNSISSSELRSAAKLKSKRLVLETAGRLWTPESSRERRAAFQNLTFTTAADHALGNASIEAARLTWLAWQGGVYSFGEAISVLLFILVRSRGMRRVAGCGLTGSIIASYFARQNTIGHVRISNTQASTNDVKDLAMVSVNTSSPSSR
jgi:glycosyltransferase involved in cell wall biosynthesis